MKTILMTMATTALILGASPLWAAVGPYMSVQVGATFLDEARNDIQTIGIQRVDTDFDTGFNVGGAIGFSTGITRVEGEIVYRMNDFDGFGGDMSALSFMANGYYDIDTATPLRPYFGGGIGFAIIYLDSELPVVGRVDENDTVFAYQIGGGVAYELNEFMALDLGYRYFATSDPSFRVAGARIDSEYQSHNVSLGFRLSF